jgi:hypothetical protein
MNAEVTGNILDDSARSLQTCVPIQSSRRLRAQRQQITVSTLELSVSFLGILLGMCRCRRSWISPCAGATAGRAWRSARPCRHRWRWRLRCTSTWFAAASKVPVRNYSSRKQRAKIQANETKWIVLPALPSQLRGTTIKELARKRLPSTLPRASRSPNDGDAGRIHWFSLANHMRTGVSPQTIESHVVRRNPRFRGKGRSAQNEPAPMLSTRMEEAPLIASSAHVSS